MILTPDQQQVKALLTETITLLCKNGLHFQSEFSIEGLIGITLDQEEVFLVSIRETIKCDNNCINIKTNGHTKGEQTAKTSPTLLRSKRHARINEPKCSDASINSSHDHTNDSSACLEDSARVKTDPSEVKMEFSKPDHSELSHSNFEESQSCISLQLTVHHNSTEQDAYDVSDEAISSENVHSKDSLEPLAKRLKRLCRNVVTKTNDRNNDKVSDHQESSILDLKVCKSEPLDVDEIPDDEVESSMNSENSCLMYLSMYRSGGGEGCSPSDAGFAAQDDLSQMNQNLLPGCSSWSSVSRTVDLSNRYKMLNNAIEKQLEGYSKATVSMAESTGRQAVTVNRLTAGPSGELLHMLYIHGKYVCQLCGKQMQRKRDIRAHMASKHFMAKDFCCKLCGAEYGYKYNLQQHMKIKHSTQLNEADCC